MSINVAIFLNNDLMLFVFVIFLALLSSDCIFESGYYIAQIVNGAYF